MNAWRTYRRYLTEIDRAQLLYGPDHWDLEPSPTQAAWDAIPLWFRVLLCARCEPRLGEWLVQRRVDARRVR